MADELMVPYLAFAFIAGSIIGSFLNVVILRLPHGLSVISPRSRCPKCETEIRAWDNIPILSWIFLRARCRDCGEPISMRYPLLEAACGLIAVGVLLRWGVSTEALVAAVFAWAAVALAFTDFDERILPDPITYPLIMFGFIMSAALWRPEVWSGPGSAGVVRMLLTGLLFAVPPIVTGFFRREIEKDDPDLRREWWLMGASAAVLGMVLAPAFAGWPITSMLPMRGGLTSPLFSVTGAILGMGLPLVIFLFYKYVRNMEAMGLGDVKYLGAIGAVLGLQATLVVLIVSATIGAVFGGARIALGFGTSQDRLPFGTFLSIGSLLWLFTPLERLAAAVGLF